MAILALVWGSQCALADSAAPAAASSPPEQHALVILNTSDIESFNNAIDLISELDAEVPQSYPPNAFVTTVNPRVERALRQHVAVHSMHTDRVSPATYARLDGHAKTAANIWNTVFRGIPDAESAVSASEPAPEWEDTDALVPPLEEGRGIMRAPGAPSSAQTSEFMAGKVVYSVVFVESSGGAGNCAPADAQTENWSAARRTTVLSEISQGLTFWTSRANRPKPLTFMLDDQGTARTSCEPIAHPQFDENLWIADALTNLGAPAAPSDYFNAARSFAHSRRAALGADWAYVIFVVDSLKDTDGSFADGSSGYAYLNGPFTVLTYDNGTWGIGNMNLVALHETGHIFGALDEYAASFCSTSDTGGYLNARNASCNNGGNTSDISVMGEGSELANPSADVSVSARNALGWKNPVGNIVDVIRTATVSITPYTPDPASDRTPTYSASAGNSPFPPGGCNTLRGSCWRQPSPVSITKVKSAQWRLDSGPWTSNGLSPTDGAFDEEKGETYKFTPTSPVPAGTHTFRTRSINNFGHKSNVKKDTLTLQSAVSLVDQP